VKLRGFRIELGEIEAALLSHQTVRESVVVVREDKPDVKRLVRSIVLESGAVSVSADLRVHLQRNLPEHMVPGDIVVLPDLPRLTNGKLDRNRCHGPRRLACGASPRAATRSVERRLVRVFRHVLRHDTIGVTDDFFDLGGHSILAVKLASAIELEFDDGCRWRNCSRIRPSNVLPSRCEAARSTRLAPARRNQTRRVGTAAVSAPGRRWQRHVFSQARATAHDTAAHLRIAGDRARRPNAAVGHGRSDRR
jgi:hypothetical protein